MVRLTAGAAARTLNLGLCLVASGLLACRDGKVAVADAGVDAGKAGAALEVESVTDIGALTLPSATVIGRDGSFSGRGRDGRVLFGFGDTFLTKNTAIDGLSVLSATSGWSTPASPLALDEPVDGAGIPAQMIPYTNAEVAANRAYALPSSQSDGWALWPGPVLDPGNGEDLVVLFQRIQRMKNGGFPSQGIGTAHMAPGATVAVRDAADLFAPPGPLFGSAGATVIDGQAYLFACQVVTGSTRAECRVARAASTRISDRGAYVFWDGAAWNSDIARASPFFGQAIAFSITYNPYLRKYLAVSGTPFSSGFQLRVADNVEGPWPDTGRLVTPSDGGVLAPPVGGGAAYIFVEHIELRSLDAK